jgi:TatD DNase family protein
MGIFYAIRNNSLLSICQENTMIDAHLHLCDDTLYENASDLIKEAVSLNIHSMLCVVTNSQELKKAYELKKQFPSVVKIAASTTPHDAALDKDAFFDEVQKAALEKKIDAIGETGLEYFHPGLDRDLQKKYLNDYLMLAALSKLPLVFHCRDAFSDLFKSLEPFQGKVKGMVHCFTGNLDEALKAIDLGYYISISGIVTFKKSQDLQEVVKMLPLDKILVETDSPYLSPLSKRGKVNQPSYIKETYEKIAELKGISLQELEKQVENNFKKMFF